MLALPTLRSGGCGTYVAAVCAGFGHAAKGQGVGAATEKGVYYIMKLLQKLYDICFPLPEVCPVCLKKQKRLQVCDTCRAEALRRRSLYGQCQRCHSFGVQGTVCSSCRQWPAYLVGNLAVWPYQDGWQQAILDFKFRNMPWLAAALAAELASVLPVETDLIVPVPLHKNRLRERGYNQSALLAKELSEKSGIAWQDCLMRVRDTPHQTGLSRSQRLKNLEHAFALRPGQVVASKRIVLVDDVFTTGSTLLQCAQELHRHGAVEICGLTLASGQSSF